MGTLNGNPLLKTDVYKLGHEGFYPSNLNKINSYLTTRTNKRYENVVFFGLQSVIMKAFGQVPSQEMVDEFITIHTDILGIAPSESMQRKLNRLVELGYWPLKIKAVKEGSILPHKQCLMTITNTDKDFAWLVGFFESMLLKVWNTCSVATNSKKYYDLVKEFSDKTCDNDLHIPFAVHDFGYRGVSSEETAEMSGMGHLLSSLGTDTVPAVWAAKEYYNAEGPIGLSVPATEHSTMSTNIMMVKEILERGDSYLGYKLGEEDHIYAFKADTRLFAEALVIKNIITNLHPTGIVSIVSDTYDYWGVLTVVAPWLKEDIEARVDAPITGSKVVFRPDSGNPVDIICGNESEYEEGTNEAKGSLNVLAEVFGTTMNDKGFKVLNPKVGLIYGDGMFFDRYKTILMSMTAMKFATSNLVIGVGGLLLQQHSRDDLGFAVKATYAEVDGMAIEVYKDPATDPGKKSHKGLMKLIINSDGEYETIDGQETDESDDCILELVFLDGKMVREQSFGEIREILTSSKLKV